MENPTTDGMGNNTKLYLVWKGIKHRCNNPKHISYKNYGGRGITICDDWLDFDEFYQWSVNNGYEENKQIDRRDNDLGYNPNNCRFVDSIINRLNKRISGVVKYRGVHKHRKLNKYIANISINHKTIYIGTYDTPEAATKAFDYKVLELRGEDGIDMLNLKK